MTSRKSYPGMGGHAITRSEFEDGILRDNARHDNRLSNEKRTVEKAKQVVVRGYDKESMLLKQRMATAAQRKTTSYFNQSGRTPMSNETSVKGTGTRTTTGRSTRLIPDYEYKQFRLKQKNGHEERTKQTTDEEGKHSYENEMTSTEQKQNGIDCEDGQPAANGRSDNEDLPEEYVSTRRSRPPEEFWNNLSAPKHQSSVRSVRERLAKEFNKPKPKSTQRTSGSVHVPVVQGTRLTKK